MQQNDPTPNSFEQKFVSVAVQMLTKNSCEIKLYSGLLEKEWDFHHFQSRSHLP
jgi:hypothetical protein